MPISLQSIILYNFKSFRGEVTIGPIQPFTAIIGPNGSGKSNIMDAISFVLGEKSSALRVKRLSELIHGASIGKPIAQSAHVTAMFTVSDKKKRSFTRMIHGESSQYKIDNEIVTSNVYMMKLREFGLGIKPGNFLISQGYIECIAMKTPKEHTAMLEQISGSDAYKADYDRLNMELLKAEDEVQFAYQMKKQLLIQKRCTMEERTEAEKYIKLQERYMEDKLKFQLIRLLLIKRTVEALQDEERKNKSQIDEYLREKSVAMFLLQCKKSKLKSSNSLEVVEQNIAKLESVIHEKRGKLVVCKETISYWQKRRDCVGTSLDSANKVYDNNERMMRELKSELEQIAGKLAEIEEIAQEDTVELSNSQIKRYMDLRNEVERHAENLVKQINGLRRDQQKDHDELEDKNRQKQELEGKAKQKASTKEELEKRLKKLRDISVECKVALTEKAIVRKDLNDKITKAKERSVDLESDIARISEELQEADMDNYTISHKIEKTETIKMLKQFFSGVHGRLSSMCKPIHSRYHVAVTKVFGRNMHAIVVDTTHIAIQCIQFLKRQQIGVETFLPLDSLRSKPLQEKLRAITEPRNVKLLYDVLNISSVQITHAVLFITKNTLVCETAENARTMAYEIDKNTNYDCVSLDGCFYRKDGTISGGHADLVVKAKQWEKEQISTLKHQKIQLMQEHKDLSKSLLMQSELNLIDIQIKGISAKGKYIEKNLKDIEENIVGTDKESTILDMELSLLNERISKFQQNIQRRDEKIKNIEIHIKEIEDKIFVNFCKDVNMPNIGYYEKNNLRIYQEREKRRIELEKQYDCIENQLHLEHQRDIKSKILKWTHAVEEADTKLNQAHQQEHLEEIAIEQKEIKLSELQSIRESMKVEVAELQKEIGRCRSQIGVISRLHLEGRNTCIAIQRKIEQQKAECNSILKDCKIENITIPTLSERSCSRLATGISGISISNDSDLSTEASGDWEIFLNIDFMQLPENIRNGTEKTLQDITKELDKKLTAIQSEFEIITNPNLKAHEKMDSVMKQIQELNIKLQELRMKSNEIKAQLESVKASRYQLFSNCLECIAAEIDVVYKNLVNDISAQAIILPDNPEEPYAGGINYSCIAPSKRFQPLQHLSGGEKSLASLALLFAIHRYKPAPLFIMDEVDAALDKENIKNVVHFIRSQANIMQFVAITLEKTLYFSADALIGVTTEPDAKCSESVVFAISLNKYHAEK